MSNPMSKTNSSTPILTLDPVRIENFAYFNAKIKHLVNKYRHSTRSSRIIDEVFKVGELEPKNCILEDKNDKKEKIDIEGVLSGFLEEKIYDRNEKLIQKCKKIAQERIEKKNAEKKLIEKKAVVHMRKIPLQDLKFIENNFENSRPAIEFTNPFVYMIYRFFDHEFSKKPDLQNKRKSFFHRELNFLENEYYDFIRRSVSKKENAVQEYVKLKYTGTNIFLESCNGRFLYTEIYTHLRCGQVTEAINLISQFSDFFDSTAPDFKNVILSFYNGNLIPKSEYMKIMKTKCDRFKILVYQVLTNDQNVTDIINTFNDFVWFKMLHAKSPSELYSKKDLKSTDECKMILALFCRKYQKTFTILLKKDFPPVEVFFATKRLAMALNMILPYAELIFSIIKKFTRLESKIRIVNSLDEDNVVISDRKSEDSTSKIVANLLVSTGNLDLIGLKGDVCQIKASIVEHIADILHKDGDRENLLRLYYLFNNQQKILEILNEYLIDLILKEKKEIREHKDVIEYFMDRNDSLEKEKMTLLIQLVNFSNSHDIDNLKSTKLFNLPSNELLVGLKQVISKLLPLIVNVINEKEDLPMGQAFSKLCNSIGLGERCRNLMGEQLVMML